MSFMTHLMKLSIKSWTIIDFFDENLIFRYGVEIDTFSIDFRSENAFSVVFGPSVKIIDFRLIWGGSKTIEKVSISDRFSIGRSSKFIDSWRGSLRTRGGQTSILVWKGPAKKKNPKSVFFLPLCTILQIGGCTFFLTREKNTFFRVFDWFRPPPWIDWNQLKKPVFRWNDWVEHWNHLVEHWKTHFLRRNHPVEHWNDTVLRWNDTVLRWNRPPQDYRLGFEIMAGMW